MTEYRIHIDRLVLRDVPPEWVDGLGADLEIAVGAAATADAEGSSRERPVPASDRDGFARDVGRQIWAGVRGEAR